MSARLGIEVLAGDLLMTCAGPRSRCGIPALVRHTRPKLMMSGKMYRFRPLPLVGAEFLEHWLLSAEAQSLIDEMKTGISDSGLNLTQDRFLNLIVPVPPITEQEKIRELLEDCLSRLDAAEHYATAALKRLDGIAESALRVHLTDVRAERPMGELLEVPLGNGKSVPTRDEGFPVLRLTALKDDGVDLRERKGGDWTSVEAQRFLVARGDFLLARGNGSLRLVGRGSLVRDRPDAVAYPDTMIRARVNARNMTAEFLAVVWNSTPTRSQIEAAARTTAGIYKVNQKQVAAIRLPVPSLAEQQRIATRMAEMDGQARRTRDAVERTQRRGAALRAALLTAAFSGKLTGRHTDQEVIEEMADA
ncbi:MAG: hypothetical protein ACR2FV_17090 [Ornithinimicrobium sp.]